jgi:integrating conjugative element protein (TIGR03761 family)
MFAGRSADAANQTPAIVGGRRFAAVLRSIWALSARDNPYADWILIRMYDGLVEVRNHLDQVTKSREESFELLRRKGLALSVMASRNPQSVELGFRSPYGYATAEAIEA